MNGIHNILSHYLAGKEIYPPIRRLLNLLLTITITEFIFRYRFGSYVWLDYTDYKGILEYVIQGRVYIPIAIFIFVLGLTEVFSVVLFMSLSSISNRKHVQEIIQFDSIKKSASEHSSLSEMFYNLFYEKMVNAYRKEKEKKESKSRKYIMEDEVSKQQSLLTENFTLAFRALVVSIILFTTIPSVTWKIFLLTFCTLAFWMALLMKFHQYLQRISTDEVLIDLIPDETEIKNRLVPQSSHAKVE